MHKKETLDHLQLVINSLQYLHDVGKDYPDWGTYDGHEKARNTLVYSSNILKTLSDTIR